MFLDKNFYIKDTLFTYGVEFNNPDILDTFIKIIKSFPEKIKDEFLRIFDEQTCIVIFERDLQSHAVIIDLEAGDILSINLYQFAEDLANNNNSGEEKTIGAIKLLHSLLYHERIQILKKEERIKVDHDKNAITVDGVTWIYHDKIKPYLPLDDIYGYIHDRIMGCGAIQLKDKDGDVEAARKGFIEKAIKETKQNFKDEQILHQEKLQ